MMGYQSGFQPKLFYHRVNLEQRVPQNHILRKIEDKIDFGFIYAQVKDSYGDKERERGQPLTWDKKQDAEDGIKYRLDRQENLSNIISG